MLARALFTLLIVVAASLAVRALDPCTDKSGSGDYMIYVDPVTFASSAGDTGVFLKRLRFAVESNVQELQQRLVDDRRRSSNMPQVVVIPCNPKRAPEQKADFTSKELKTLDEFGVVLELWGLVLDKSGHGEVGYALVSATSQKLADPAIYTVKRVVGSTPDAVQRSFAKDPVMVAYATISVGTRLFQNRDFSNAASYLCNGAVKLGKIISDAKKSHPNPIFVTEQSDLLAATLDLRKKALQSGGSPPLSAAACPVEISQ